MTVEVKILLAPGESLTEKLRDVGLLPQAPEFYGTPPQPVTLQPDTYASIPRVDSVEPPKRRPGRPRKGETPAPAVTESDGEPVNPVVYLVRRYGGEADSEHGDPAKAVERLLDLAKEAMDPEAIEALSSANEGLIEMLPASTAEEVQDAFANLFASLDQPTAAPAVEPASPAPAANEGRASPAWPFGQNQQPLAAITLDAQGARDAIMAIVAGPEPKFGLVVAQNMLAGKGIPKLSALPDGSPIFAEVAREGAALLGLPVTAPVVDLT